MKLTVTFIVVAFGSMLASAAESAVVSSATSSAVASSSAGTATSKIAVPTPAAPNQAAPTPAGNAKITIPLPKPQVVTPQPKIRPSFYNHWFGQYRPAPRPFGIPTKPNVHQFTGSQGTLREKRSRPVFNPANYRMQFACAGINGCGKPVYYKKRSIPEESVMTQKAPASVPKPGRWMGACGKIGGCGPNNFYDRMRNFNPAVKTSKRSRFFCLQLGGCGGNGGLVNWRNHPKRANGVYGIPLSWKVPPTHVLRLPPRFRGPVGKRSPIIAPSVFRPGFPFRRPGSYPPFRNRVNARAAEAAAEPEALWCNPATGTGCGSGYRRKNGGPIAW